MWRVSNLSDEIRSRSGEVGPNFSTSIERIMRNSGEESLDIVVPMSPRRQEDRINKPPRRSPKRTKLDRPAPWMGWNPRRSDAHEAIDDPSTYHHRIPPNVKHLLINATVVRAECPGVPGLVDRVHDSASRERLLLRSHNAGRARRG